MNINWYFIFALMLIASLRGTTYGWRSQPKSIFLLFISIVGVFFLGIGLLLMLVPDNTHPSEPGVNILGFISAFIGGVFGFGSAILQFTSKAGKNIEDK